ARSDQGAFHWSTPSPENSRIGSFEPAGNAMSWQSDGWTGESTPGYDNLTSGPPSSAGDFDWTAGATSTRTSPIVTSEGTSTVFPSDRIDRTLDQVLAGRALAATPAVPAVGFLVRNLPTTISVSALTNGAAGVAASIPAVNALNGTTPTSAPRA